MKQFKSFVTELRGNGRGVTKAWIEKYAADRAAQDAEREARAKRLGPAEAEREHDLRYGMHLTHAELAKKYKTKPKS